MKDLYGQKLELGDDVVYSDGTLRTMNTGKVIGFTKKRVQIYVCHVDKYGAFPNTTYNTTVSPSKLVAVKTFKEPVIALGTLITEQAAADAKYISDGGMTCPYCGETEIDIIGDDSFEGDSIYQTARCECCNKVWSDVYTLEGFSPHEEE